MKNKNHLYITLTGLFAAMITIMTAYIGHIPFGSNSGYIHFGDALIYLAAALLPRPYALAAAVIGGGLADLFTSPLWTPATIIIKMLIVLPFTGNQTRIFSVRNILAPVAAAFITVLGYYAAAIILFGSPVSALTAIIGNVIQAAGSAVIFYIFAAALNRVRIKSFLRKEN